MTQESDPDREFQRIRIVLAVLALVAAVVIACSAGPLAVPALPPSLYSLERIFRWAFGDAVKAHDDTLGPEPPPEDSTGSLPRALVRSVRRAIKEWRDNAGRR